MLNNPPFRLRLGLGYEGPRSGLALSKLWEQPVETRERQVGTGTRGCIIHEAWLL